VFIEIFLFSSSWLDSLLFGSFASSFYLAVAVARPGRFRARYSFSGSSLAAGSRQCRSLPASDLKLESSARSPSLSRFSFSRPSFPGPSS
jgi:hypothetical protein